jgi:monovalent cation:H+ antiporter-2, CPA2 family
MPHNLDLILTLTGGLTAALGLGFATQKLKLSPIVGYLLAGILVGPFSPGYVADTEIANQFAEIGVILLMFGVGLHFHLKDLLSVRKIAIPGAIVQILAATALGAGITRMFGWSWSAGIVFGMAISVASTVVLTRVLADNRALHTPSGHIAIGWLIVEDLFTILVLVLLPALFATGSSSGGVIATFVWAILKLAALIGFALIAGQRVIPWFLGYVARTGSRDLFTLAVLVLALGIAVGSAQLFGASMALGAFLAGMIVGQSEFSARSASDALPMRDAFAVLFFVSVGMLFDPTKVAEGWPLMLATLAIVLVGKPVAALVVVLLFGRPVGSALSIAVALAQIGEFSFILASLASSLNILPAEATNALVVTSVVSITLNPLLYKCIEPTVRWLERKGVRREPKALVTEEMLEIDEAAHLVIVVGYGPVGRTLARILKDNRIQVVVIETNLRVVQDLRGKGELAVYGDASLREILRHADIEKAEGLIVAASNAPADNIIKAARELNPEIRVLTRSTYLRELQELRDAGADAVFSSEGEVALAMTAFLMRQLGATDEQIDRERDRVHAELFSSPVIASGTAANKPTISAGRFGLPRED